MDFLEKILQAKEKEVAAMPLETLQPLRCTYSFYQRVKEQPQHMHIIGEVKRASPSKGDIRLSVDICEQALAYEQAGVTAISVLTDELFFKGSIEDLRQVVKQVTLPVLCKDFIIDEKQLIRARNAGATMVLLIVAALSEQKLNELYAQALGLGLEVLMEVHNEQELAVAQQLNARIIGVNNRNLKTFEVAIEVSERLAEQQTDAAVYISESGFSTGEQVAQVKANYQAVLVGESLMRSGNPQAKVQELRVKR
ncbi:indole-3-glycerol phosphate synthase TrpC [Erwinia sp. CPCC 100877]|nr:indole-3-glycerol phosphate synthase TrpC [Erwinia sp. CPCC 100877]